MKIIKNRIEVAELKEMSEKMYGNLVKAVVDIKKEIMAVDGELHSDLVELLIEKEKSEPRDLWGVNFYPEETGEKFIEFDSVINIKPSFGNRTRGVESEETKNKIISVAKKYVA